MNIRRQYSLPNCTLVLEGLSDGMETTDTKDGRPLLTILVNAECYFVGFSQKLHGGRIFLENLVTTVSSYAQECLSGIRHPQEIQEGGEQISLEKIKGTDLHRLAWQPPAELNQAPVELQLTTVQLFDLVEAVDQFFSDSRTLPDFSLKLQPVSRRYRQAEEPLTQRVVPPTVGLAGLALTAIAVFMLPMPSQVRKPDPNPKPQASPTQTAPSGTPAPVPGATPAPTPTK